MLDSLSAKVFVTIIGTLALLVGLAIGLNIANGNHEGYSIAPVITVTPVYEVSPGVTITDIPRPSPTIVRPQKNTCSTDEDCGGGCNRCQVGYGCVNICNSDPEPVNQLGSSCSTSADCPQPACPEAENCKNAGIDCGPIIAGCPVSQCVNGACETYLPQ